ncbi:MAG: cellulase family glycosylhydrolase [Planctomycetota bacterium]
MTLRGMNLGNWLVAERWMMRYPKTQFEDQAGLEALLAERFGEAEMRRLVERFREHWITRDDLKLLRSFGFNTVRVPLLCDLLLDDADALDGPGQEGRVLELRDDAWRWLDRVVAWAEAEGMYVILDLHGTPGRQSREHHTGRHGVNRLWDSAEAQRRTVWLWRRIAERYAGRPNVVAYDLINEPYADFERNVRPELNRLIDQIVRAVREVDPDTVMFAPAVLGNDFWFYGSPAERGWTHVGFTFHPYPGRYGSPRTQETFDTFFGEALPWFAARQRELDAPILIGEFGAKFEALGGAELLRRQYDAFAGYGWAATAWGYKVLTPDPAAEPPSTFGLLWNAEPVTLPDLRTASLGEIEAFFTSFGTMRWTIDEVAREALSRGHVEAAAERTYQRQQASP